MKLTEQLKTVYQKYPRATLVILFIGAFIGGLATTVLS